MSAQSILHSFLHLCFTPHLLKENLWLVWTVTLKTPFCKILKLLKDVKSFILSTLYKKLAKIYLCVYMTICIAIWVYSHTYGFYGIEGYMSTKRTEFSQNHFWVMHGCPCWTLIIGIYIWTIHAPKAVYFQLGISACNHGNVH